ncbi:MAG: fibronectin type III domain-containing protein [Bacteroidetes bacterium]|nr:fibronectin type III domain-containing protein [Bacteroidota bacterium]
MKITTTFRFLISIFLVVLSSALTIKSAEAACNLPAGLTTTNITVSSAKFNWAATVADSFLVRYNVTGTTAYFYKTVSSATATSTTITGLYPATSYQWVVRTYCSGGTSGGYQPTPASFSTAVGTVSCVIPNQTATNNITSNNALISWNVNVNADTFMIRYSLTGSTNYTWIKVLGTAHSYNFTGLLPNTSYTWVVRCICASNPLLPYSASNSFTTLSSTCGVADPYYYSTTALTSNSATIGWRAVTGAVRYNVRYAVRYSNNWVTTTATTATKTLTNLSASTWYEFQIQIVCSTGAGAWSTSGIFQTPAGVLTITRGPYLNLATQNSIYIRWRSNTATDSKIKYGTSATNLSLSKTDAVVTTEHIVQLTGLAANTKYYYSIGSSATTLQGDTGNYFMTHPVVGSTGPVRIWTIGDFGVNSNAQNLVRDAYRNYSGTTPTNVWLWVGDNAYSDGTDAEYSTNVFAKYPYQMKNMVIWPATGNHDLHTANAAAQSGPYFDIFTLPKSGEAGGLSSGTEAYYSFNYANVHFICLESTDASFRATGGNMATWLTNDLNANTQRWTVVYFHHPPYSKGSHNSDTETELIQMRTNIVPILENKKVDLVLSGHSHSYERSMMLKGHFGVESTFNSATMAVNAGSGIYPASYTKSSPSFNGTVYAVCGVSGQIGSTSSGWPHNAMYSSSVAVYGSLVIDVLGDRLDCKFLTYTGSIFDQFTIQKSGTPVAPRLSDDAMVPAGDKLSIFPNPIIEEMNVRYFLDEESDTRVEITDVTGRIVYSLNTGRQSEGEHEIKLTRSEAMLPSGIYIFKLISSTNTQSRKIIIED